MYITIAALLFSSMVTSLFLSLNNLAIYVDLKCMVLPITTFPISCVYLCRKPETVISVLSSKILFLNFHSSISLSTNPSSMHCLFSFSESTITVEGNALTLLASAESVAWDGGSSGITIATCRYALWSPKNHFLQKASKSFLTDFCSQNICASMPRILTSLSIDSLSSDIKKL